MAENLLSVIHTDKSVLHEKVAKTYSTSLSEGTTGIIRQEEKTIMANLQSKEQQYYQLVGENNYIGFKREIQKIISRELSEALLKLGGAQLRKELQNLKKQYAKEETTVPTSREITIDISRLKSKGVKIQGAITELRKMSQKSSRSKDGSKLNLTLAFNSQVMKKIINKVEKNSGKDSRRQFREDSGSLAALIERMETDYEGLIYFTDSSTSIAGELKEQMRLDEKFLGYPWNFDKSDVTRAVAAGEGSALQQKLVEALRIIEKWLKGLLPGGDSKSAWDQAITTEWNKIVSANYANLTDASFFLKGGYIDLVVGALGEFQAAVFNTLINISVKGKLASSIQGNVFVQGSEQAKADVLFGQLGIQVKNYASASYTVSGNIHPAVLEDYYGKSALTESGVFSMLVHGYGTENHGLDLTEIESELSGVIEKILSLDSMEKHQEDHISFYMIAGKYLVPASVIIDKFADIGGGKSRKGEDLSAFQITGPSSKIFSYGERYTPKEISNKYWIPPEYQTATVENINTFESLLSRSITLRANFTPSNLNDLELYNLFNR